MSAFILERQIFSLVGHITGHQPESLEKDMFLEGDLGLDSLKMIQLMNDLIKLVPEEQKKSFSQEFSLQDLMQLQTLGEVSEVFHNLDISQMVEKEEIKSTPVSIEPQAESLEILDSQYFFLAGHWAVNSNSLCSTLRLQGDFDVEVAWQSWQDLIARHPLLRASFVIPSEATSFKDYQLKLLENPLLPEILITDLRKSDNKEEAVKEEFHRWLNYEWNLQAWPLHQFSLFRLEDSVYQLFLSNEHLISDGLSNPILLSEFMEIYRANVAGEKPDLPPATTVDEYREIVQKMNAWYQPEEDQKLTEHLSSQGRDSYIWNPDGQNFKNEHRPEFHNLRFSLDRQTTAELIEQTKKWRTPLNTLLLAAYLRTIASFDPSPKPIAIQVPTSGRVYPGIDAGQIVSSFAQNLVLSFERSLLEQNGSDLVQHIQQEIAEGLVNGYDRNHIRRMAKIIRETLSLQNGKLPEYGISMMLSSVKSNLYLPYTGHTQIKSQYDSLAVVGYQAGGINTIGTIDLLQEIFDERLHLFASYDRHCFSQSRIESLVQAYILQIKALITALEQDKPPILPSYALASSQPQLESLLQDIAAAICHQPITSEQMDLDLEADLGIDSLDRIRIITRLEKAFGQLDRQSLFSCRSLREIEAVMAQNRTETELPYLKFVEQAQQTPEAIAFLQGHIQLTYQALHFLSNQVAHYLRSQGVGANTLVGIMTQRGPLMLIGILGILKAGGAYVPLDPAYPDDRLRYMLEHAEISLLLSEQSLRDKLINSLPQPLPLRTLIFLDEGKQIKDLSHLNQISKNTWSTHSEADLLWNNQPDDLMTVLYTSGSTGRPKGVMLNHRGYMNRLVWMQNTFQLQPGDRVAQKTSCCFDISVWELLWPLMVGATVCPLESKMSKNPWQLAQWMQETQINILHFVPSLFGEFLNALAEEKPSFPHLRWLIFSGEALPVSFIQQWIDRYGLNIGLANLYGPTEASIDVTAHLIQQRPAPEATRIPIGKAIDNVQILILDEQMQPLPPGQMGELWIAGVQLAKGYLKDPQRTSEAFRPNPFAHISGESLYRTGDLAKQLPDGSFEYHGRIDHQVKIRGFRVELGEIESVLNAHPSVQEAAVVVMEYEPGQQKLVAGWSGQKMNQVTLKDYLSRRLPDYMIPHRLEWLPSLPKNHNGKLDRKALQAFIREGHLPTETVKTPSSNVILPLGPAQRWLISYFESPYQWYAYTRFRYHQALDPECFNLALGLIMERHPALRTIFVEQNGQWQQRVIDPQEPFCVEFYDGSHLEHQKRERLIQDKIEQISQQFQIETGPLFKPIVVKINKACYEVVFVAHHLIGDMLSGAVLFKELWQAYSELLINPHFRFKNVNPLSYVDFVRLLQQKTQGEAFDQLVTYWKTQFPSQEYSLQIPFDFRKGENLEASAASQRFTLDGSNSHILLRQAKQHHHSTLYTLLLAPLYRLMADWCGQSWVVVSHRTHGRDLGDHAVFWDSFGNFAVNFPLGIQIDASEAWDIIVNQIKKAFADLPLNGVSFDWVSEKLPAYLYPDRNLTPIRANYLGNRSLASSELFEFIEKDCDRRLAPPGQKRTTLLEFFFSVKEGQLELEIEYSQNFHRSETIQELGNQYLERMQELLTAISVPQTPANPRQLSHPEKSPLRRLENKVALVTGGSGGIGRATALAFAREGAKVVLASRRISESHETVRLIEDLGSEALFVQTDVRKAAEIKKLVTTAVETYGHLDCVFNNAGIEGNLGFLTEQTEDDWDEIIDINLKGVWLSMKYQIAQMLKQGGGTIVNNASIAGLVGFVASSIYVASKHGVLGLTKSAALEYAKLGIRINAVCPAAVQTPLFDRLVNGNENAKAQFAAQHPLGRIAQPEEIAEAVIWLSSDASSFMTGHSLAIDGGYTAR